MIEACRKEISEIDREIFTLIKRREILSSKIGHAKRKLKIADRDFKREKEVFERAHKLALELDLPIDFTTSVQRKIIELSLSRQEKDRIKNNFEHAPKSVLIIGGAGRLGGWLCGFFADSGHKISVVDKIKPGFSCDYKESIDSSANEYDIIVVATPIRVSVDILDQLAKLSLKHPVVFDVSSVKAPVHKALLRLKDSGVKVTSLHPMFGPNVGLLFGKHIIQTSLGDFDADERAKELFNSTSVQLVEMSIDEHDQIIGSLLSLSHIINIIFVSALSKSGISIGELENISSPTFLRQLSVAKGVFLENPNLYFEIQALNPNREKIFNKLNDALIKTTRAILESNENEFVKIMSDGLNYLTQIKPTQDN